MPWYVLYTKPRNEKKTAALLAAKNVTVYCPTQTTLKQWSDRKKKIEEPVFKSYIFVHLNDYSKECAEILSLPGAVKFVWWQGKPGIVHDREIDAIKTFLGTYEKVDTRLLASLRPGGQVLILSGPLRDQTGDLIQVRGGKAHLKLTSLGLELTAEVPVAVLQPL